MKFTQLLIFISFNIYSAKRPNIFGQVKKRSSKAIISQPNQQANGISVFGYSCPV